MPKEKTIVVDLVLDCTDDQVKKVKELTEAFKHWCEWLEKEAPEELKKYKPLCDWAYPKMREFKLYNRLILRVVGKVSRKRVTGKDYDPHYILYDIDMFSRLKDENKLKLRLLKDKEIFPFSVLASNNIKEVLSECRIQSGVLQECDDGRILFKLKVYPPRMIQYIPDPVP